MAFNSKNLSYDRQEPAFLRKLRGESSGVDSPRQERFSQRPRKPKNKDDDDDDAPTYVDEETNDTITREDYEALLKGSEDKSQTTGAEGDGDSASGESKAPAASSEKANIADAPKVQEKMAEIGSQKRKKQAKVVGGDDDDVAAEDEAPRKDSSSSRRPKAKKKKVKLSFDEA